MNNDQLHDHDCSGTGEGDRARAQYEQDKLAPGPHCWNCGGKITPEQAERNGGTLCDECKAAQPQAGVPAGALTTLQAADIGREMGVRGLIVHRDPVDRSLWQVVTPGRVETHEPMDEPTWRAFLAASGWIEDQDTDDGPAGSDEQELFDAVREQLSPHAVAAIACCHQINRTNNPDVDRQVRWFQQRLVDMLGGYERQSRLAEELGL